MKSVNARPIRHEAHDLRVQLGGESNGTFVREKAEPDGAGNTEKLRRLVSEKAELAVGEIVLLGAVSALVRHRPETAGRGVVIEDTNMRALFAGRKYHVRLRLYYPGETGNTAVMLT